MFRVLALGALLSLIIWVGTVSAGLAVAVMRRTDAVVELSLLVTLANVAAPFLGGFAAGWVVKKRGWVHGGWVGVLYTIMAALAASAAFEGFFTFNASQLILNFCLGCTGGICGVNMGLYHAKSRSRKKVLGM